MNTRAKGRKHELSCKKQLEKDGWKVIIAPTPQRWQKAQDGGTDFFGLFDIIAIKGPFLRFIQVKSNVDSSGRLWKVSARAFKEISRSSVEIWIYVDRVKEPRIKTL